MPYKFRNLSKRPDKPSDVEEIPFKVRIRPGKESRLKPKHLTYLDKIRNLQRGGAKRPQRRGKFRGDISVIREPLKFSQRVLVKSRVVHHKIDAGEALRKHITYLQRDGVGVRGDEPTPFDEYRDLERREVVSWAEDWSEDRHHFRFIISPENGSELDLKKYARELVSRMERDQSTKLEWVGVTHHNTDQPHVHLLIRGKDDLGSDLVIARDYISNGLRNRAQEVATRELGFRNEQDMAKELERSITQARPSRIDRVLLDDAARDKRHLIDSSRMTDRTATNFDRQKLRRLGYLEEIGLAKRVNYGLWKLEDDLIGKLRLKATKGDIVKTMHLRMRGIDPNAELTILDVDKGFTGSIKGTVLHKGLSDELFDVKYLIVRTENQRAYYVPLTKYSESYGKESEVGDRVSLKLAEKETLTRSDENIAAIAAKNGGVYDLRQHLESVKSNKVLPAGVRPEQYVLNHERRIRTLSRMGLARSISAGRWELPSDLVETLKNRRIRFIAIDTLERMKGHGLGLEM